MPDTNVIPGNLLIQGNLLVLGTGPAVTRASLVQDNNTIHAIPWPLWRIWDAITEPLPSEGTLEAAASAASHAWDANSADDSFFVAVRKYRVLGITARVEVAGTDGGAVTAAIKKAASGTDIASGTALHTGTINLKGTVDTNQSLTLSATSSDLDIAAGNCIGIDFTGTLTSARGTVTVLLAPAPSADDLILVGGVYGTDVPSIQTGDVKAAGTVTKYARALIKLPAEYQAGQLISIRVHAGMKTTVAGTSAVVDIECFKSGKEMVVSGSDLCTTAAQSINSLTFADKDFTITPTGLLAGDELDIRLTITTVDGATGTAVIGAVGAVELLAAIKG